MSDKTYCSERMGYHSCSSEPIGTHGSLGKAWCKTHHPLMKALNTRLEPKANELWQKRSEMNSRLEDAEAELIQLAKKEGDTEMARKALAQVRQATLVVQAHMVAIHNFESQRSEKVKQLLERIKAKSA